MLSSGHSVIAQSFCIDLLWKQCELSHCLTWICDLCSEHRKYNHPKYFRAIQLCNPFFEIYRNINSSTNTNDLALPYKSATVLWNCLWRTRRRQQFVYSVVGSGRWNWIQWYCLHSTLPFDTYARTTYPLPSKGYRNITYILVAFRKRELSG